MKELFFTPKAWEDYTYWQTKDKKILLRINSIIKDLKRNPFDGIGMPEALKHEFSGYWSRRIDSTNRLVYEVLSDNDIRLIQCKGHYGDK